MQCRHHLSVLFLLRDYSYSPNTESRKPDGYQPEMERQHPAGIRNQR